MQHMKNRIFMYLFACITFIFTLISFIDISKNTVFIRDLTSKETLAVLCEFSIIYIILLCINKLGRKPAKLYLYTFLICICLYLHQISLAIITSALYVGALIMAGEMLLLIPRKKALTSYTTGTTRYAHSFIIGATLYIILICLMSLTNVLSIKDVYIYTLAYVIISYLLYLYSYFAKVLPIYFEEEKKEKNSKAKNFLFMNIIFVLLLQASKLNISLDYDSLRYALRSPYVLMSGKGIYENLGLINSVYNYPKGLEILTLPLNMLGSYSFIQAFSFVIFIFILFVVYEIVKNESNTYLALCTTALLCFVPSVVNMSISAKADIISLFICLVVILDILKFIKNKNTRSIYWIYANLIFSTIFKPTSIVFSSFIGLVFLLYLFFIFIKKKHIINNAGKALLIPAFISAFLVHLRTFFITGYFIGSVFTGIWERLGLNIKYPYKAESLPNNSYSLDLNEKFNMLKTRIYGLFIAPSGEDMLHIYIAFAGIFIFSMFIFIIFSMFINKESRNKESLKFLNVLSLSLFVLSIYSLYKLYQVDGNYYILLYSLILITFVLNYRYIFENYKKSMASILFLPCLYSLAFILVTNWAGELGTTKIKLVNKGFYEHSIENKNKFIPGGEAQIYEFLEKEKGSRLLSIAYEPKAFLFPITSQTYTDVTGSGGNVFVVKYLDYFKDFLEYAKIDYIYTEEDYLQTHNRAEDIVKYMIEDASLELLIDSGATKLYKYIK